MAQKYRKRPGTAGIRGPLYETKLLSLIHFRAIHDDGIEEFHLATNVDKVGSFDDICFKAKFKGNDKPLAVFLQAKHRENQNSVLTLNKTELAEYFNSYFTIRRKFSPENKDVLFNGKFDDTECLFVIYTTAKGDEKLSKYKGSFSEHLNALIRTGEPGSQPLLENNQEELLCGLVIEEHMTALARLMAKCIFGELNDLQMLMQDELVIRYHAILGQKAFNISEIQPEGHRNLSFRDDFFDIDEEYLRLFKDELCTEILKRRKGDPKEFKALDSSEITDTETLYKQFGSLMIYKNGKFVLDKNAPQHYKQYLDKFNESQESIRKTVEMAVKECLPPRTYEVPASFGNKDLTITRKDKKLERKLNDLASKIVQFIEQSKLSNTVTIDDTFGEGFLQLNGGIASAVGNLLVFDETSNLMKFNDNYESLGNLGKRLYHKLKEQIDNLNKYKFDVKAKVFPKLSFATDEYDKRIVSEFLRTLLFFTSQCNEKEVEQSLIYEINISQGDDVQHVEVTSDAIFLKYHDEIQKWSMESKQGMGTYLGKEGKLYKDAEAHATTKSLMNVLNMMQTIKYKQISFKKDYVNSINFDDLSSGTIIVTENVTLTVAKLVQHFNKKNTVVLDLEYVTNLSARDDQTLRRELMNTDVVKTLIVVFNNEQINNRSKQLASSMKHNIVIIITDKNSVAIAKQFFSQTGNGNVIEDEIKLIDMCEESQKRILENTKVIFQGNELSLGQILINDTIGYVEGNVLNKMMHSKNTTVGKPVGNSNYKPKLYIQRSVRPLCRNTRTQESVDRKLMKTLDAFEDDVVIIFGDPGMGKSTLLTDLSIKTKENCANTIWIVRVNLLEHTTQFRKWKDKETNVDTMEALKFLSQVSLSKDTSKMNEINVTLEQSIDGTALVTSFKGDAWTLFELRLFLSFYNSAQLIILFDGFDEICPTYANEVLALIQSVKNFSKTHKMWITSRPYDKMHSIFEKLKFAKLFEIEPLDVRQQDLFLSKFWDEKEISNDKDISKCVGHVFRSLYDISTEKPLDVKQHMPYFLVVLNLLQYFKIDLPTMPAAKITFNGKDIFEITTENLVILKLNFIFYCKSVATPLHLNIMADYFYSKIKEMNITQKTDWYWDYIICDIYEYYLETKLKKIHYQEKTQNDMSKPDNISVYEREYADTIDKHKKLAAYAVYYDDRSKLFDDGELNQIVEMIAKLKEGELRTGIVCNVVDDIPMFVHSTLEEYLVVEYICGLIKSKENQIPVWDFILNVMFFGNMNVMITLNDKMKVDHDLLPLFEQNKKIIFDLLIKQGKNSKSGEIKSSISEAIRYNLRDLAHAFIPIIKENLNERNLMDFIEIVRETNMLLLARKEEYIEVMIGVATSVKSIDESKLSVLFENTGLQTNLGELSDLGLQITLKNYVGFSKTTTQNELLLTLLTSNRDWDVVTSDDFDTCWPDLERRKASK